MAPRRDIGEFWKIQERWQSIHQSFLQSQRIPGLL